MDKDGQYHTIAEMVSTDVSLSGLGLLSKVPFPIGNVFWLELKSGTEKVWRIQAKVVFCRTLFADVFRLGAVFVLQ